MKRKKRFKLPKLSKGQKIGIGVGVGLLAAVVVFGRRRIAPGLFDLSFADSTLQSRGIRNNNPGNILYSASNDWAGKVPYELNTDQGRKFEQFKTYVYGVRAMIILLQNYLKTLRTISQVVYRWNPSNSNYVRFVADRLGMAADAPLKVDKQTIKGLVQAIADFENGITSGQLTAVSDDVFEAAWSIR